MLEARMSTSPRGAGATPVADMRAGYRAHRKSMNSSAPIDVATRDIVLHGPSGPLPARHYACEDGDGLSPGLVYFHGGGFVVGDLESHDGLCRRLTSYARIRVIAIDYRLAPEHPFPAAHDDALAAVREVFDRAAQFGVDVTQIGVGGCSAGGNIAASVALDLRNDPDRRLALQALFYPVTWPSEETSSRRTMDGWVLSRAGLAWFEQALGAKGHPDATRTYLEQVSDLTAAPPALLVTAGYDPLRDEGQAYIARLRTAGVQTSYLDYPDLVHDFLLMADVSPAVGQATWEIAGLLSQTLRRSAVDQLPS